MIMKQDKGCVKVSIVMCTYNGERFLKEQLDSLLRQTVPFYELIVQDDGSTDATISIIESYKHANPDRNILLYRNNQQLGFCRNFLTAFQKATGEYIACCDQDDVWMDDKLEVLLNAVGDNAMVFHNSLVVDEHLFPQHFFYQHPFFTHLKPLSVVVYPRAYGHQIMFREDVKARLASFVQYNVSYDYLINAVAGSISSVLYVHKPLVKWRRYAGAETYSNATNRSPKWKGYVTALQALCTAENRRRTKEYFFLLSKLTFADALAAKATKLLSTGHLKDILLACMLCFKHFKQVQPVSPPTAIGKRMLFIIRAFFLPLFFIRDHGRYIVK